MQDPTSSLASQVLIFGLMLGMGLALTPADFRRVLRAPGPVVVGLFLQLVLMPLFAFAIAVVFDLPPLLALGLVVCGGLPGGAGSNTLVYLADAHVALSISLTATATLVTLVTLPLWIGAAQDYLDLSGSMVRMPILETAIEIGALTVLPVGLGMLARGRYAGTQNLERPLTGISSVLLVIVMVAESASQPETPLPLFEQSFQPVLCLSLAAAVVGLGVPLLFGQRLEDASTIAVELTAKNSLLGFVVLASAFRQLEPSVPLIVYSGVSLPLAALVLVGFRLRRRRLAARGPERGE